MKTISRKKQSPLVGDIIWRLNSFLRKKTASFVKHKIPTVCTLKFVIENSCRNAMFGNWFQIKACNGIMAAFLFQSRLPTKEHARRKNTR